MSNARVAVYIEFDSSLGRRYRKISRVLAFRSNAAFVLEKPKGVQRLPPGSWLIVPVIDGFPSADIHGCEAGRFAATYHPCSGGESNLFEKHALVSAYQPGIPFEVRTVIEPWVEVDRGTGNATDWLVRNHPGGELYAV